MPRASPFFCDHRLEHLDVERLVGDHRLQPSILILKGLQLLCVADLHLAVLSLPAVVRLLADAEPADDVLELRPRVDLLQHCDDLLFLVPALLQGSWPRIPKPEPGPVFRGRSQNGSGFSAFAAFIDTETNREAIWRMPDVTSNAANPFQPDNTLMGNVGSLPDDSLGEIETHVRLLASGSDLWKMSATFNSTSGSTGSSASGATTFEPAILKVNVRNRNANAVGLASDAVIGEAVFFGTDANGTAISLRTGPQFAYDIGTNEVGAQEMRFVYMAADTSGSTGTNFHLQGGFCPVNDLTQCRTVAQWISPPLNEAAALFPAIKFGTVPGTGQPAWKVTF
jgi:hypothetical protein